MAGRSGEAKIEALVKALAAQPDSQEAMISLDAAVAKWIKDSWHKDRLQEWAECIRYPPDQRWMMGLLAKFPVLGRWAGGFALRALNGEADPIAWDFGYHVFHLGCRLPGKGFQELAAQFISAGGCDAACAQWLDLELPLPRAKEAILEQSRSCLTTALLAPGGVRSFLRAKILAMAKR